MKEKVFLGGTYSTTTWREKLLPYLDIDYFNPIVKDWTPEAQIEEEYQKEHKCDIHLYVITSQMKGVFSIAEVIDSVHEINKFTIFVVYTKGFSYGEMKSLTAVGDMVVKHGGAFFEDLDFQELGNVVNNSWE